ncbi:MAG TPA: galactose-1-phosphate uridylyltransferase [Candidatus Eisenbacteria bacterium]|nr:galactose-1-phosphate uridylyltransferase [Candidatus Eisenbacteria bacterium]
MPELRRDPVLGYWTIISTERSRRPMEFKPRRLDTDAPECPFCEGHERQTPGEVYALRPDGSAPDGPGWRTRVFLSKVPILPVGEHVQRYGQGLYDVMEGAGRHEIIVECPDHKSGLDSLETPQIESVIRSWAARINAFEKDPLFTFAFLFANHGLIFGSPSDVVRHSRSQMVAMPITPKRVKEELLAAKIYFERRDRCVFCDIVRQESADKSRMVAENDSFLAFCPFASRSPFEIWVMPRRHSPDFGSIDEKEAPAFAAILKDCLGRLRTLLDDPSYNSILHTAPYRHKKRETHWKTIEEDYHWYFQISPRLTQSAGFEWGTGIHINPTPPEDAALLLREVKRG